MVAFAAGAAAASLTAFHVAMLVCDAKAVRRGGKDNPLYNLRRKWFRKLAPPGLTVCICSGWEQFLAGGSYDANDPFMRGWLSVRLEHIPDATGSETVTHGTE